MALDYRTARDNMVENDIRTSDVSDRRVLTAFRTVPREVFVPAGLRDVAYAGTPLQIGPGRAMMPPRVLAKLVQALEVPQGALVLIIGCGTGYSAAILAHLAETVVAVESDAALAASAEANLAAVGADNVVVVNGPLEQGAAGQGPFDAILVDGAVQEVPGALTMQLKREAKLAAVVAGAGSAPQAHIYRRIDAVVSHRRIFDAAAPLLPGFQRQKSFVF